VHKLQHDRWLRLEKISLGWNMSNKNPLSYQYSFSLVTKELSNQFKKYNFKVNSKRLLSLEVAYSSWLWNLKEESLRRMSDEIIDKTRRNGVESLSELSIMLRL